MEYNAYVNKNIEQKYKEFLVNVSKAHFVKIDRQNNIFTSVEKLINVSKEIQVEFAFKDLVLSGVPQPGDVIINGAHSAFSDKEKLLWNRKFISYPPMEFVSRKLLEMIGNKLALNLLDFFDDLFFSKYLDLLDKKIKFVEESELFSLVFNDDISIDLGKWVNSNELKFVERVIFGNIPYIYVENGKCYFTFGNHIQYFFSAVIKGLGNEFEEIVNTTLEDAHWNKIGSNIPYSHNGIQGELDHLFENGDYLFVGESKATKNHLYISGNTNSAFENFEDSFVKGAKQLEKDSHALDNILKKFGKKRSDYKHIIFCVISIDRPAVTQAHVEKQWGYHSEIDYLFLDFESLSFMLLMNKSFFVRFLRLQRLLPNIFDPVDFLVMEKDDMLSKIFKTGNIEIEFSNLLQKDLRKIFYKDQKGYSIFGMLHESLWLEHEINLKLDFLLNLYLEFDFGNIVE